MNIPHFLSQFYRYKLCHTHVYKTSKYLSKMYKQSEDVIMDVLFYRFNWSTETRQLVTSTARYWNLNWQLAHTSIKMLTDYKFKVGTSQMSSVCIFMFGTLNIFSDCEFKVESAENCVTILLNWLWTAVSGRSRTFHKGALQSCFSDSLYNQPNFSNEKGGWGPGLYTHPWIHLWLFKV